MADLTEEEIAELRFSVERATFGPSLGSRVPDALPRLLAEVERRRACDAKPEDDLHTLAGHRTCDEAACEVRALDVNTPW